MMVYLQERSLRKPQAKHSADAQNSTRSNDIKAMFIGHMGEAYEHQGHMGAAAADWAGLTGIAATRTESACASSGVALRSGIYAAMSGLADVVLVGGVEKMTHRTTAEVTEYLAMASDYPFEQWHGITFPGLFAMMATAHMQKYGTTRGADGSGCCKKPLSRKLKP